MTVFVVSLFLPYTVHFNLPEGTDSRRTSDARKRHHRRHSSSSDFTKRGQSLFQRKGSTASNISKQLKEHAKFFSNPPDKSSISSSRRASAANTPQSGGGYPFPPASASSSAAAAQLAPSDPNSPKWGEKGPFNQPKLQISPPPSPSILAHGSPMEKEDLRNKLHTQVAGIQEVMESGKEDQQQYAEADWSIVRSHIGNGGLRNAVQSADTAGILEEKLWMGTLGMPTDALNEHTRDTIAERLQVDHDCLAVYVEDSDFDGHYLHFCKTILWPVFHYQIPDNPKSKAYEDHSWIYYERVNRAFADEIIRNYKRGDVIWIHDYHLLLVPNLVRERLPDAQIGIFLHVAFPSSEVFRCLAVREKLLRGMLGANLVGFQTAEYCRHFLQTCSRILSVEASQDGIQLDDRFVNVGTFPIGIDPKSLDERRRDQDVHDWIRSIKKRYEGKRIVVARDKLDNIRGVRHKLLAYELFLNMYPHWRDKVVLIQVAATTTDQPDLEAMISDIAQRVNSSHSSLAHHQPLVFLKQDLSFSQYLALMTVADVLMVTSLREGMNLTSHEFIHCQDGKYAPEQKHGCLVLSEFTGSASVFDGHPLLVNPWNYRQCAEMLNTALEMTPEEREKAWKHLNAAVTHHTTINWLQSFLEALSAAWKEQAIRETSAVPRLSVSTLSNKYRASSRRLFIIDYEGTLASWGSPTSIILTTPQRAIDALDALLEDTQNTVYVTSSRTPEEMERLFQRIPALGLIAENGCFIREPNTDIWLTQIDLAETRSWKSSVADMMNYFQERTEGSWIEERHSSVVFHYANCEDQLMAERHASECATHINDTCESRDIHAIPLEGQMIVEPVVPNKATAAGLVLENIRKRVRKGEAVFPGGEVVVATEGVVDGSSGVYPDFLLVIGDGREDEVVFRWANKLESEVENVLTVTLGGKNTEAKATLTQGVTGVLSCLHKLAAISQSS